MTKVTVRTNQADPVDYHLTDGDVMVIGPIGNVLEGEEAWAFRIRELERALAYCHRTSASQRDFIARASKATTIDEITLALVEYAGIGELP